MHGLGAESLPALGESSLQLQPEKCLMQDQYSGVSMYEKVKYPSSKHEQLKHV